LQNIIDMKNRYTLFTILVLLLFTAANFHSYSQTLKIDSLNAAFEKETSPAKKIEILDALSQLFKYSDMKTSEKYVLKMVEVAENSKDDLLLAIAYNAAGIKCVFRADTVKALFYLEKSLKLTKNMNVVKGRIARGNALIALGTFHHLNGRYKNALPYYYEAEKMFSELKEDRSLVTVYSRLADIFKRIYQQEKYELYCNKLIELSTKLNDDVITIMAKNMKADILHTNNRIDEAEILYREMLEMGTKNNNLQTMATSYFFLARIEVRRKNYEKALELYEKSYELFLKQGLVINYCETLAWIADTYYSLNQYSKGLQKANQSIELARQNAFDEILREGLLAGSKNAAGLGKHQQAFEMLTEYLTLYEKNVDEKTKKQIAYAAEEFESEKKALEIINLKAEGEVKELTLKKRNLWLFGLSSFTALLILALFTVYRSAQHKKRILLQEAELKEQKINELEKEKLLVATRAVMQGEEKERTRLARDLHDSLGGMLSGIKLKISNAMKGNVILPEDMALQFENTLGLLDSTIGELRHIANNLMPESLMKFGLKTSLTDFCSRFNEKEAELVNFQYYGDDKRFESEIEIAVFRIAQELISNSLKHGQATKTEVQIIVDESRICLQVMDNGVGFVKETAIKKGHGLKNIENRVAALNGHIETQSEPGKGTETVVEFQLSTTLPQG